MHCLNYDSRSRNRVNPLARVMLLDSMQNEGPQLCSQGWHTWGEPGTEPATQLLLNDRAFPPSHLVSAGSALTKWLSDNALLFVLPVIRTLLWDVFL